MSMLEWLGESFDPGPMGEAQLGPRDRGRRSRAAVMTCGVVAVAMLLGYFLLLGSGFQLRSVEGWLIAVGALLTYLIVAYVFHPQPDYDNIGWFGGLFDHPFRYSDDINRMLLFFLIVLFPGRFITESLVDTGRMIVRPNQRKKKRRKRAEAIP